MGEIKTTNKKFIGDAEIKLKIGDKELKLKVKFGEEKAENDPTVKSFYYYNEEKTEFTLKSLLEGLQTLVPALGSVTLPTDGIGKAISTASIGIYELYGDISGQLGLNMSVRLTENPFEGFINLTDLEVRLNLARVFEGATGLIPGEDQVFKLLPADKTYSKIAKEVKDGKILTETYSLTPIKGTELKQISSGK